MLERNADFGLETSARNSEVLHAGLYYPPGSLKARYCRDGRQMLVSYLAERNLPYRLCGKLIVATSDGQRAALQAIRDRAEANGVMSLRELDAAAVKALEPELRAEAGLYSPDTVILDSRAYMQALLADLEDAGGQLACNTTVRAVTPHGAGHRVETESADGEAFRLHCAVFINAAGLGASDLAGRIETGPWTAPATRLARGTYYGASGRVPFRHLVYPVPEPGGLGVHLTLDLQGSMRFGPDVEWIDRIDYSLTDRRRAHFQAAIARYWPGIAERSLEPVSCGIRPKLAGPGEPDRDFLIAGPETHGIPGLVQLFGIESPGLTSSLAIAKHVAGLLG